MADLSLPRHQWRFHQVMHEGRPVFGLWTCVDCWQQHRQDEDQRPPDGACPGPGPHNPQHIALVKRIWLHLFGKLPKHLREG